MTPVGTPPADLDYDMWLGPAEKKPYRAHRGLYHFRWFWDFSGGQMTNLGAHTIDQILYVMNVKGPTLVSLDGRTVRAGGRWRDSGHPGRDVGVPGSDAGRQGFRDECRDPRSERRPESRRHGVSRAALPRHQGQHGPGGELARSIPEQKGDPVNDIPRFMGHPVGGPVYTNTKPTPWIEASKGQVAESDPRYGTGGEDTMAMNEQDWINCIRSRQKPFCDLEEGHRVSVACILANMSLKLGRAIQWDPEKEAGHRRQGSRRHVREAVSRAVGQGAQGVSSPSDHAVTTAGFEPEVQGHSALCPSLRVPTTGSSRLPGRRPSRSPPSSLARTPARAWPGPCCASDRG